MKKVLTLGATTLFCLVISVVPALFLATHFGLLGPLELKIVRSGSMEPAIHTGGLVFVRPAKSYKIGDVITFGADTKTSIPTTHRIVSIRSEGGTTYYTTKGDANDTADPNETPAKSVIGKVVLALPYAGYILAYSKTRIGFGLLVVAPALLVIGYEALGIVEELKRKRRRTTLIERVAEEREQFPPRPAAPMFVRRVPVSTGLHFDIETEVRPSTL